ncbi:MAG: hypothetical protein JWQ30_2018 [Sediminibacterium sp.]|nr:hypothetical protein [Sediminibacterium sp.]
MSDIERLISVFNKNDESLVSEINVDHINLEDFRIIFSPPADDRDLCNVYPIGQDEAFKLKPLIDIDFNFSTYVYQLDYFAK